MINLLWLIICAAIAIPFITNPKKITERPGCKIKSPVVIRILGIVILVLAAASAMCFWG